MQIVRMNFSWYVPIVSFMQIILNRNAHDVPSNANKYTRKLWIQTWNWLNVYERQSDKIAQNDK